MQFDEKERFFQGVAVEDNCPIITLFTRDQLADIDKFCMNEDGVNSPFCADMTYDIGNYYVVVATYRHLQLVSRENAKEPILIGPVMICTKKNRETYQHLSEDNKALELEFPFAVGFLCRTHVVRNIGHKVKSDLHLSDSFYATVVRDVFGDKLQQGLVNCSNRAEFDLNLSKLKVKWNRLEHQERKRKICQKMRNFSSILKKIKPMQFTITVDQIFSVKSASKKTCSTTMHLNHECCFENLVRR